MAAGRVVDERINAIPQGIAGVKDLRVSERDGDVTVGVSRPIMLQRERGAVEIDSSLAREDISRNGARGRRRKVEVLVFDRLSDGKMLAGILMGRGWPLLRDAATHYPRWRPAAESRSATWRGSHARPCLAQDSPQG
jgi:hypothetical protein